MSVQAVNITAPAVQGRKSGFNPAKITGYGALGFGIACGIAGVGKKMKPHKVFAYIAGVLAVVHAGLIEWHHFNRKKS